MAAYAEKKKYICLYIYNEDEIDEMLLFIRDSFIPAFIDLEAVLKVKLTEAETDWE